MLHDEETYKFFRGLFFGAILSIILWLLFFLFIASIAHAEEIDLDKIMMIESSGNPLAVNRKDDSIGLFQITPIVLKEWNNFQAKKYTREDLFNPIINKQIAEWYLNTRIPSMLRHYKIKDSVENRIIAYNAGISYLVRNKQIPNITKNYIKKYFK